MKLLAASKAKSQRSFIAGGVWVSTQDLGLNEIKGKFKRLQKRKDKKIHRLDRVAVDCVFLILSQHECVDSTGFIHYTASSFVLEISFLLSQQATDAFGCFRKLILVSMLQTYFFLYNI